MKFQGHNFEKQLEKKIQISRKTKKTSNKIND